MKTQLWASEGEAEGVKDPSQDFES